MPKIGLVVSGGAAKGAFAVGVVERLQEKFNLQFDLVAGTSTGALIAPLVVSNNVAMMKKLYSSFSSSEILIERKPLEVYQTGSVFDTSGLRTILEANYTQEVWEQIRNSNKQMFITTVNLQTGRVVYFFTGPDPQPDQDADFFRIDSLNMLLDAIFASTMIPVIMPTVKIKNHQFVDGGVREIFPCKVVINNGAEEIFGIILSSENEQGDDSKFSDLIKILKRIIDLSNQEVALTDIRIAEFHNDAINYIAATQQYIVDTKERLKAVFQSNDQRTQIDTIFSRPQPNNPFPSAHLTNLHLIRPAQKLMKDSLVFSRAKMRSMILEGRQRVDEMFPTGIT